MSLIGLKMQQDLLVVILYSSIYNQYKIVKTVKIVKIKIKVG